MAPYYMPRTLHDSAHTQPGQVWLRAYEMDLPCMTWHSTLRDPAHTLPGQAWLRAYEMGLPCMTRALLPAAH
eukprot:908865-Pelagomonas_calceolata.AAC.7